LRVEDDLSLSLIGDGEEGMGVKKKAKIGVQTKSARKDGGHEEKEKEEEEEEKEVVEEEVRVGGHCDCLALTFASHILPGCQWHSTDEFSVTINDFSSRTKTHYCPAEFKFGCFIDTLKCTLFVQWKPLQDLRF